MNTTKQKPKRFDAAKYLNNKTVDKRGQVILGGPANKILERGELCGVMYTAYREPTTDNQKSIIILTDEGDQIYILFRLVKDCLVIDQIDSHDNMFRFEFVRRLIWLTLSEAKDQGMKEINGKVMRGAPLNHKLLLKVFRRYWFAVTYNTEHYCFYFSLE
jgi:hypothetical protein